MSIIYNRVKVVSLVEDTMQEVFLRFYKTIGKVQTEDDMRRWLFKIAKNAALDCTDKNNRNKNRIGIWLDDTETVYELFSDSALNPLNETLKQELSEEIAKAIATLKPIHADAIRLYYYFGYTPEEIAKMTNVPTHTIYSRLSKAKALLFSKLSVLKDDYNDLIGDVFDEKK